MAVNKVEVNGETKLDLTQDTVTPETLLPGAIAHSADGNAISGAAPVVRYDAAQTLTEAQKAQARGNIGAAPDGFGLGGSATLLTSADNLDTLMKNGWYYYGTSNAPQGMLPTALASYANLVSVSVAGNTCVQEAFDVSDSNLHGTVLRRTVYGVGTGAKIYPWEWVNPPLSTDVEYRTTERYLGKPVYAKLVDCGAIPEQGTHKDLIFSPDASAIVSVAAYSPIRGNTLPYYDTNGVRYSIAGSGKTVMIWNYSESMLDTNVYALVKYTKTTD